MSRVDQKGIGLFNVFTYIGDQAKPVQDCKITVLSTDESAPGIVDSTTTDASGRIQPIELPAPEAALTQSPSDEQPWSEYVVRVEAEGFVPVEFSNVQIFDKTLGTQFVQLAPLESQPRQTTPYVGEIIIDPHTLFVSYPPKIPEDPFAIPDPAPKGSVVLDAVVVPELVQVHNGVPDDPSAPNYTVDYRQYLKNVASSEIYATWPLEAIKANLLCINSFILNRIFTEHYRGKGFTITASTAYDQKFTRGQTIYDAIDQVVEELFTQYIALPGKRQPFLTQYCDGVKVKCPGWLTQWGSKYRADEGRNYIEILKEFYGPQIEIREAPIVEGIPESYPGSPLQEGSTGPDVRKTQEFLNEISNNFPAIPKVRVDGVFGPTTTAAVKKFQEIFNLPQTGVVDRKAWYKISDVYSAVEKLAVGPAGGPIRTNNIPSRHYKPQAYYVPTVQWVPMWVPYVTYKKKYKNIIK